jgi:hypothetical protein
MVIFEARTIQALAPGLDLLFELPKIRYLRFISTNIAAMNNQWSFPNRTSTVEELEFRDCHFDPPGQTLLANACRRLRRL